MGNNENKIILFAFITSWTAILLALGSAGVFFNNSAWAAAFGVISTIISTVLGMVAILYTYFSGTKTLELLNKIELQNRNLVDKINLDLLKNAYDENGLEAARTHKLGD